MKYIVEIDSERREVEVDGGQVRIDGDVVHARLEDVDGTPILLVGIGSELHRVALQRGDTRGRYTLWMDGYRYDAEALDERTRAIRDLTAASLAAGGPRPLSAPMPGLIVRVLVAPGDAVQAGQPIIVMEAMKMENELRAVAGATVARVHVAAGVAVEKGALLVDWA